MAIASEKLWLAGAGIIDYTFAHRQTLPVSVTSLASPQAAFSFASENLKGLNLPDYFLLNFCNRRSPYYNTDTPELDDQPTLPDPR